MTLNLWHRIELAPLLPEFWLWAALGGLAALTGLLLALRAASGWRLLAVAAMGLMLFNPVRVTESREGESNILLVVVDDSPSQQLGDRKAQTDAALAGLEQALTGQADLRLQVVRLSDTIRPPMQETALWEVITRQLAGIPAHRLAGVVALTDGQIHDLPETGGEDAAGAIRRVLHNRPLHAFISGSAEEYDRWLEPGDISRFATVGQQVPLPVTARSSREGDGPFTLTIHHTDGTQETRRIMPGEPLTIPFTLKHTGENVVLLELEGGEGELTTANNRQVVRIHGMRDTLRVLLITGKVYPGQRVWRNFLKADPSIDLVHFNILRNVQDEDGVPVSEMSLIPFPVDELFGEKIDRFDLIVIDQFTGGGLIPRPYLDRIARFVQDGGALLFIPDPEKAFANDLLASDIHALIPLSWEQQAKELTFTPLLTEAGRKHPVTAGLGLEGPRKPGAWYRLLQAPPSVTDGFTVLQGPGREPLLILSKPGKGRVCLLLTDQLWLWARGHGGGGPFQGLVRNMIHWLLGEPNLEDTQLAAELKDRVLTLHYRSVAGQAAALTVRTPSGEVRPVAFPLGKDGSGTHTLPAEEPGIYTVSDGTRQAYAIADEAASREWRQVSADSSAIAPVVKHSGGGVFAMSGSQPEWERVAPGAPASGRGWAGWVDNAAYSVTGSERRPLAPAWVYFLTAVAAMVLAWRAEAALRPARAAATPGGQTAG